MWWILSPRTSWATSPETLVRVQVALIAHDRARDGVDPVASHELGHEPGDARSHAAVDRADEAGAAERGVAAAAQVEAAFPYAAGREVPDPQHRRGQARGGAHQLQRSRGRVELLHGCRRQIGRA